MPTLNWIGKDAVVNHHRHVPYHLLKDVPELSCGDPGSGNLIVEGDNLVALKALLPYYAGQVKCVYIDPPYNTGNEGWAYNDNVNSPVIRQWLGHVVGKEGETLDRHDRWLCMMYPRLTLLKEFLRDDGIIFISIDEVELANLCLMMDEIFGVDKRLTIFTWVRKKKGSNLSKEFRKTTEFIVAYKRSAEKIELKGIPAYAEKMVPLLNRPNPVSILKFKPGSLQAGRGLADGSVNIGIKGASKGELAVKVMYPTSILGRVFQGEVCLEGRWRWSQATVDDEIAKGSTFVVSKDFRINVARYNQSEKTKAPATLLTPDDGVGTNEDASEEIREIFPESDKQVFQFPKPSNLIAYLIRSSTGANDLVLDSFAGSGTTAHAVLKVNAEEEGARKFIGIQMANEQSGENDSSVNIARDITAKRISRVAEGYTNGNGDSVDGLGGGFRYCQLGEPLFDATGQIRESVRFADLARHVYFSETGEPLPRERITAKSPLLGVHKGTAIYLLYNGILGDRSAEGGNVLTRATLALLPAHEGPRVVFCAGCLLSRERLHAARVLPRQVPYEIKTG